tara:strand:- start:417 stop:1787 length:1371 start_codon:yes stop_codon:yes gene_type:complete
MITINNTLFDYKKLLSATLTIILFGILLKVFDKRPYVIFETFLLGFTLIFSITYLITSKIENMKINTLFYVFLSYLFIYNLSMVFLRPFEVDISFYDSLFFAIQEFRVSTLGYFLPLLFVPLAWREKEAILNTLVMLGKIAIIYTIFEQVFSLMGFREAFEALYYKSGVVSENLVGVKSLGLYRIWGFVGSPQLLGVFHIITLFYMLHKKETNWAVLSTIAIMVSTSKTSYLILILIALLYLIVNKKYLYLSLTLISLFFISLSLYQFNSILVDQMSDKYMGLQNFIQSIIGYFSLTVYKTDVESYYSIEGFDFINREGPLVQLYDYFSSNPGEILFGKGITYSFMDTLQLYDTPFGQPDVKFQYQYYVGLSSDFYILTYFEQYGLVGIFLLILIFFVYPVIQLYKEHSFLLYIPIIFFLATLHYPPQISKLMMLFVSYPVSILYFTKINLNEKYS